MAARAGATYVSPFLGRLDDIGQNGVELIATIAEIFAIHDIETEIIAASIRHPQHITEAALAGAHISTTPFNVLKQLFNHPLTDKGIEGFLADWEARRSIIKEVLFQSMRRKLAWTFIKLKAVTLKGTVKVSGAKNSAVALIPASILADSPVTIEGFPEISDAWTLKELLEEIGGKVTFENGTNDD